MTLLSRIKMLCKDNSITLAKLEKNLNFGNGTLSRWDTSSPSVDKIQKLSEFFDVDINYLLGETDDPNPTHHNVSIMDEDDNPIVLDDETLEYIDSLRSRPEMKMLFSVSKKATKDDIIKAVKIIEALKDESK